MVHRDSLAYQGPERVGVSPPGPLGLAVGFVASIIVTMIFWAFEASSDPRVGLVLLTLTAIAVGAVTTLPAVRSLPVRCAGLLLWLRP